MSQYRKDIQDLFVSQSEEQTRIISKPLTKGEKSTELINSMLTIKFLYLLSFCFVCIGMLQLQWQHIIIYDKNQTSPTLTTGCHCVLEFHNFLPTVLSSSSAFYFLTCVVRPRTYGWKTLLLPSAFPVQMTIRSRVFNPRCILSIKWNKIAPHKLWYSIWFSEKHSTLL